MLYDAFPWKGPMVIREPDFALFDGIARQARFVVPGLVGTESDRYYPGFQTLTTSRSPRCPR